MSMSSKSGASQLEMNWTEWRPDTKLLGGLFAPFALVFGWSLPARFQQDGAVNQWTANSFLPHPIVAMLYLIIHFPLSLGVWDGERCFGSFRPLFSSSNSTNSFSHSSPHSPC